MTGSVQIMQVTTLTSEATTLRKLADEATTRAEMRACWAGAAALLELHRRQFAPAFVTHRGKLAAEIAGLWRLAGDTANGRRFAEEVRRELEASGVLPSSKSDDAPVSSCPASMADL